jgi:hypothetical protein
VTRTLLAAGFACALAMAAPAAARAQAIDHQYETWVGVFINGPIAGDLFFQGDLHYRVWDDFTPHFILVRPGVGYRLMDGMFVTVGYAWTPSWSGRQVTRFVDEHRVWEQFSYEYTDSATGIRFSTRTRLEQRFRHPTDAVEVGWRLREMLRTSVPLSADRNLTFVLWDELFIALSDSGRTPVEGGSPTPQWQYGGFDQNRIFVGLGYQFIAGVLRLEAGYFNQWIRRPGNAAGDLANHAVMLNAYVGWR